MKRTISNGLNLPNALTLSRIFLSAVFLFFLFLEAPGAKGTALLVFLLASLTDFLDGWFAKRHGKETGFGALMDPIADKILTLSAFIGFVQLGILPAWMVILIITRDFLITGLRLTMPKDVPFKAARRSGKHKTFLQLFSIIGVLFFLTLKESAYWNGAWTSAAREWIYGLMCVVVAVTVWSGIRYVLKYKEYLDDAAGGGKGAA